MSTSDKDLILNYIKEILPSLSDEEKQKLYQGIAKMAGEKKPEHLNLNNKQTVNVKNINFSGKNSFMNIEPRNQNSKKAVTAYIETSKANDNFVEIKINLTYGSDVSQDFISEIESTIEKFENSLITRNYIDYKLNILSGKSYFPYKYFRSVFDALLALLNQICDCITYDLYH